MSRTVLVSGSTSGFGAAVVRARLAAGDRVIGTGRRRERLDAQRALAPERFLPLVFDVRDADAVRVAVDGLPAEWRAIDVLVNNAGLALGLGRAPDTSLADWRTMIETNCWGLAALTQAVLPGMVARGRGDVVMLGSIASTQAYPGGNVYGASKAFVAQFAANLRSDLLGKGVRVMVLEPGSAQTEFSVVRFGGDAARAEAVYSGYTPLSAEDVSSAVSFVIDQPAHVTIARMELWPTAQAPGGTVFHRRGQV